MLIEYLFGKLNRGILIAIFLLNSNFGFTQNGKILSKKLIELSQSEIWPIVSKNNSFTTDFSYLSNLNFYFITYQSDNLVVNGLVIEPKTVGKYPIVIFNRGGNGEFGQLTLTMLINYTSKLAAQGFVIIASNYRVQDEFGGVEINDILSLTNTVREIENADATRIGMFGWSRGGMMTYLALKKSNKIKTAIIGNGPTDLIEILNDRPMLEENVFAKCIPGYWENKELELINRSASYWVDELNRKSSLLILCGTDDNRVNPEQADKISNKLKEIDYNFELIKLKTDHYFSDKKEELNELVIDWFIRELKVN